MRQKLFTKQIDEMLFKQYPLGNDLSKQMVVAKIFNPYGNGIWYLLNSDPNDPDYLWAIVDLYDVEVGSVSRQDLETIKVPPFGLNLERDMYFQPVNAKELYDRVRQGERFAKGGTTSKGSEVLYLESDGISQRLVNDKSKATAMWIMDAEYYLSSQPNKNASIEKIDKSLPDRVGRNYIVKVEKTKFAKGGIVITSIKDIPNLEQKIKNREVTYRGLGMGKLADDFYKLTGDSGTRIKVDGKEYFITQNEFDTIARDKEGNLRIRFSAPKRKYADGGMMGVSGETNGEWIANSGAGMFANGGRLSVDKKYDTITDYSKYAKKGDFVLLNRPESDLEWIDDSHLLKVVDVKDGEVIFKYFGKKGLVSAPNNYSVIVVDRKYADGGELQILKSEGGESYLATADSKASEMAVKLEHGGGVAEGNLEMVKNQAIQIDHHAKELKDALKSNPRVDGWVVSLTDRATSNLSDVTHYLEGQNNKFANGGKLKDIYVPITKKISENELNDFVDYVDGFYGKNGIYAKDYEGGYTKSQIRKAVNEYIENLSKSSTWGGGDSLDRERVREVLSPSYYANGGKTDREDLQGLVGLTYQLELEGKGGTSEHKIAEVRVTPPYFTHRDLTIITKGGGEDVIPFSKLDEFLNNDTIILKDSQGESYAITLIDLFEPKVVRTQFEEEEFEYAKGGLTEHGLMIGDTIIDKSSANPNSIQVMNNGHYALVNLDKGDRIEGIYKKGGKLIGDQYKLDLNKNGRLDSEDFKMLRGEKMADGGEVEIITNFIGNKDDADDFIKEYTTLTKGKFSKHKTNADDSWRIEGIVTKEAIEKYNLDRDFMIVKDYADGGDTNVTNEDVYDYGEILSSEFSRKIKDVSYYYYTIEYNGKVYEIEVSDDGISQEVEFPKSKARLYADGGMMAKGGGVAKYKVGDMVYTYQNPDEKRNITYTRETESGTKYKISLRDKDGYSYSGNFIDEKSISKTSRKSDALKVKSGKMSVEDFSEKWGSEMYLKQYAKGGKTKFNDKVKSIAKKLLEKKKVPKKVQKDYGKTFSRSEAIDSAKRIAGAMRKKEMAKKKR